MPHEDDVERLAKRWGLRRTGDLVTQEIGFQLSSAEVPLIDEFPNLRLLLTDAHRKATLLRCTELTLTTRAAGGQTTDARDRIFDGARVYWLIHDLADPHREDAQLLNYISEQLQLKLTDTQIAALVKNREDEEQRRLRQLIRHQTNDVDRLLTCLGADVLRRYVPSSLIDAAQEQGHEPDDRTLAEMALAVHGVEILREARGDLEDRRLQPPSQWAGGRAAQEFVRDLGFGREYAGFQEDRRDQILEVIGPVDLKELHDFQAVVKDRFRDLLRTTGAMKRAMLSLPTGAGKTRVAVQSLVEHFAAGEIGGPVLWVAQSEELCEQAVQAWAEVWRAMGPSQALTISRLWDANSAEPVDGAPQVVVATIQKLDASVVEQPRYGWLAEAAVVVVDEAHRGATTPTTTRLFQWLGLETRGIDRCPLVGLTATPFIGTNVEQGKILARRYGKKRLDTGLFPEGNTERLIALLQQRRILSRVDHRTLEGVDIDLDENEMDELNTFQRLPRAVEARLGVNADRNRTLVKSIREHPTDWQILLFSASVEHARTLAALLRLEGITAAAITGETRPGARRHYVQQFKDRKIRVLTNYGTLTTGFDAPEVRAVYIARPTYSPNLYLQMIGRGLRGPINGGTEQCLIVDVKDNVQMYGGSSRSPISSIYGNRMPLPDPIDLTDAQQQVATAALDDRMLVTGGPGTGKTHTLVRRIESLLTSYDELANQDILSLSFSRAAVGELRRRLAAQPGRGARVRSSTFDSYATRLLGWFDEEALEGADYDRRIELATELVHSGRADDELHGIRHVCVDEAQDLTGIRAAFVLAILYAVSGGFTVFADPAQAIYDFVGETVEGPPFTERLEHELKGSLTSVELTDNRRTADATLLDIASLGALIRRSDADRDCVIDVFSAAVHALPSAGEIGDAAAMLAAGAGTALLTRRNSEALTISDALYQAGVSHRFRRRADDPVIGGWLSRLRATVESPRIAAADLESHSSVLPWDAETTWAVLSKTAGPKKGRINLDDIATTLSSGRAPDELLDTADPGVVVSTIHRAKGLEFDTVLIVPFAIKDEHWLQDARVLYVGLTRAKRYLLSLKAVDDGHWKYGTYARRWTRIRWAGRRPYTTGVEISGADASTFDPTGRVRPDAEARPLIDYLHGSVQPGDPVTLVGRDTDPMGWIYDVFHNSTWVAATTLAFGDVITRRLGLSSPPPTITGARVETVATMALEAPVADILGLSHHLVPTCRIQGIGRWG
ncbi:UvrD-helicase domain-containing protein [Mycolicibacterium psychrotolerans]|uniref:UvrD-helicase domain-containing protein n=1 Tax=Mycolicibacterium psychrotolerans TaxID=216929 RepID=UPI003D670BC5